MALSYAFNANTDTPEALAERRRLADLLAGRIGGATTYGGGIGDLFAGLAVGLSRYGANKDEKAGQAKAKGMRDKLFKRMFSGAGNDALKSNVRNTIAGGPTDMITAAGNSIAGIESGGNYDALGPTTRTGDRAYGKYQVMGANIPEWSEAATGQRLTPEEFLAMPGAQDKIFNHRFGGYLQEHSPQDAASMWFTGKPLSQGAGLSDQLGTSGQEYADRFMAGVQQVPELASYTPPQPAGGPMAPQQVPQAPAPVDPAAAMAPAQNAAMAQMQPAGEDDAMIQQMLEYLDNGFGSAGDKAFIGQRLNSILEKRQQASDPAYQADLQMKQLQLQQARKQSRPATAEEKVQYGVPPTAPLVIGADGTPKMLDIGEANKAQIVPKGATLYENGQFITPPVPEGGAVQSIEDPMKITKDYQGSEGFSRLSGIAPTLRSMYRSLGDPSAMADLDFVYGLAKVMDPTSVVRESEGRMVIDAQGIGPQLLGQLNKFANGEQAMDQRTRINLFQVAQRRVDELKKQTEGEREFYSKMATENSFNPDTYLQQVPTVPELGADQNMVLPGAGQPVNPADPPDPRFTPEEWSTFSEEEKQQIRATPQ